MTDQMEVEYLQRLQAVLNELDTAVLMRQWETVESVANKLRQFHLEQLRGPAPAGDPPSERASQVRPMTDEEWADHQAKQQSTEPTTEPTPG